MAKKKVQPKKETTGLVEVRFLASNLAGKYLLPWSPGHIAKVDANQAAELIEAGDAEAV